MRRTYRLNIEGKNRDRLIEASKHDIRKYIRRERRKELPAGADFWDFDTKFGFEEATAEVIPPAELIRTISAHVATGAEQFYVEVVRKPGKKVPRQAAEADADPDAELDFDDQE